MAFNIFAMPSSSILLLFSIVFSGSNALPWTEAQQTHVYEADAWSPRPTHIPRAADPLRLFSRDSLDVQICGWLGGNSASAATCSPGSSCIRDTIHGVIGCCATSGPCTAGVYTSCVDMSSSGWTPNSGIQTNGVFTCSGTALCYKNTFPGGYYQFGCGEKSWATTAETTYSGMASNMLLQQVFTGVDFKATPSSTTSRSTTSSTSASLTSLSSTLPTASRVPMQPGTSIATSTAAAARSKKSNTGAIIGGVVGGLVGLALVGGALLWLLRRRKTGRAGPFKSAHSNGRGPISGPFQRFSQYQPYGPDDFNHAGEMAAGEPFPTPYRYTDVARSPPMDIHHQFYSAEPSPPHEEEPLVSEIEDFSQNYHRATGAATLTDEHESIQDRDLSDSVPGGGMGAGVSKMRRKPVSGTGVSNTRTQDRDVTDEPLRSPAGSAFPTYHSEGWEPVATRSSPSPPRSGNGSGSSTSLLNRSPSPILPARSPMRDGVAGMGASLGSAVSAVVGRDNAPRYQLVDETRGDMPVLTPPTRPKTKKMSKSVKFEEGGGPADI